MLAFPVSVPAATVVCSVNVDAPLTPASASVALQGIATSLACHNEPAGAQLTDGAVRSILTM